MFRVTNLDDINVYTQDNNFYSLKECEEYVEKLKNSGIAYKVKIICWKVLICDRIVAHNYPDFQYVNSLDDSKFILESLLLGPDHIELYKLNGPWDTATDTIRVEPLMNGDLSLESLAYHGFDKLFPQSAFLSRYLVDLFDKHDSKQITTNELLMIKDNILNLSFCENQKRVTEELVSSFINNKL